MRYLVVFMLLVSAAAPAHAQAPFDLQAAIADGPPMTADRAAERARATSPSVARAQALARVSEVAVTRASEAMIPRLELTARYVHVDGFPDGQITTGGDPAELEAARMLAAQIGDPASRTLWLASLDRQAQNGAVSISIPRDQLAFSARLTWPVSDLFFAMLPALESAGAGSRARRHQVEATEAQVERSAREAFYQLARARGVLAVAQQAERQAEGQRERIDAAVRAGFLTEADRLAAEARVAAARQSIASAEAAVEIADAALRMLIGEDDGAVHGIAEPLLEEGAQGSDVLATLMARAVEQRPELEAVRETLVAQRAAARASDASGYPRVALFAGADLASPNRYIIPPNRDLQPSWEVGAALSWSPNDALMAARRGEELAAQYVATEAELDQLERAVRLEVRQAHASMTASLRSMEAARAALTAAEAAYAGREAQLRAGQATTADLFAAESELDRARLAVLEAAVQHRLARAALRYAIGDGARSR